MWWWWIASWSEDEQYKGKNSYMRRGVLVLGELVWVRMIGIRPSVPMVVASPIYRGPGPLPKYRAGRDPTTTNLKGHKKYI